MKIIGIDPGLSGAIAVLENNKVLNIFDIPVMSEGKKNKRQLNSALLVNLLKENINKEEEVAVVVGARKPRRESSTPWKRSTISKTTQTIQQSHGEKTQGLAQVGQRRLQYQVPLAILPL